MGELTAELERLTRAARVSYPTTRWGTRPEKMAARTKVRAPQHKKTLFGTIEVVPCYKSVGKELFRPPQGALCQ